MGGFAKWIIIIVWCKYGQRERKERRSVRDRERERWLQIGKWLDHAAGIEKFRRWETFGIERQFVFYFFFPDTFWMWRLAAINFPRQRHSQWQYLYLMLYQAKNAKWQCSESFSTEHFAVFTCGRRAPPFHPPAKRKEKTPTWQLQIRFPHAFRVSFFTCVMLHVSCHPIISPRLLFFSVSVLRQEEDVVGEEWSPEKGKKRRQSRRRGEYLVEVQVADEAVGGSPENCCKPI